jgi:steroid delta-isomerase-like uncharacterized protein
MDGRGIDGRVFVGESGTKAVVRRWIEEVWTNQNLDLVDEIFAPSYTVNGRHVGPEGVRASVQQLQAAFGEPVVRVEDLLGEGDRVVLRWRIQGRHDGVLFGIPATGRAIELTGTNIYRISEGRIVENWENVDVLATLGQLGRAPG